jgi:hypothetical protein
MAPYGALAAGILISVGLLVHLVRGLWFAVDDFDFLLHRSMSLTGDRGLLVPHNEHWSTIPILLFRLDFALFGMHHYLPYAVLAVGCHALIALLVFVLLRASGVGPWVGVLGALVVAFVGGGAGSENTLWDFQVGFLASGVFGLFALLALAQEDDADRRRTVVAAVSLILALMSSGIGLLMVFWVGTYLLFRDGVRRAVLTTVVPVAIYGLWFVAFGHRHSKDPAPILSAAPTEALKGLGNVWSAATAMPQAGPAVLVLMVAAVFALPGLTRLFALAASGLVTMAAAYALFGYTRSGFGPEAVLASRYIYFGILFSTPALAAGMQIMASALSRRPVRVGVVAWSIAVALVAGVGVAQVVQSADRQRVVVAKTKARIVAAGRLAGGGASLLRSQPMPLTNAEVTAASLRTRGVQAALPSIRPGRQAELDVAANLQVDVRRSTFGFASPTQVTWLPGVPTPRGRTAPASRCEHHALPVETSLEVPLAGRPVQVHLVAGGQGFMTLLRSGAVQSEPVQWSSKPGESVYVASTAEAGTLKIVLPPGDVTLCLD